MAKFRTIHHTELGDVRREKVINLDQIVTVETPHVVEGTPPVIMVYTSDGRSFRIVGDDMQAFRSLSRRFGPC